IALMLRSSVPEGLSHPVPAGFWTRASSAFYGGIVEETLLRWGVLTALFALARRIGVRAPFWSSNVAAALLFGALHLPSVAFGRGSALAVRAEQSALRVDVPDVRVSGQHLRISRVLGEWVLEDLKSRNGTLLDGSRVDRIGIADGALIEAGQTFFIFRTALP